MIIPMDKLLVIQENKYIFTKAAMATVEKIGNIKQYPENNRSWKVVPNILSLILNNKLTLDYKIDKE